VALHIYMSQALGTGTPEAAVLKWAENHAELYRAALVEGIQETMRMIHLDLPDSEGKTSHMGGVPAKVQISFEGKRLSLGATMVDRSDARIVFRTNKTGMFSVARADARIDGK